MIQINHKLKSVAGIGVVLLLLTSCGSKLYSYRKTVKVKSELTKVQARPSGTNIYITVQEVKAPKSILQADAELSVEENTIYDTTKPIRDKAVASTGSISSPVFGASIR